MRNRLPASTHRLGTCHRLQLLQAENRTEFNKNDRVAPRVTRRSLEVITIRSWNNGT